MAVAPSATGISGPSNLAATAPAAAPVSSGGSLDSILGGTLGGALQSGANIYGAQNAAEAQTQGELAGITTQNSTQGNINSLFSGQTSLGNSAFGATGSALGVNGGSNIYSPYTTAGAGATNTLASTLGTNGQPADYSNFLNMPGYQFAVSQGTQAIQRASTANGSAYTPNTMANIGQYVTGTAMGDYNTYVQQLQQQSQQGLTGASALGSNLLGASGVGSTANTTLSGANLQTGSNISQLQQNTGNAQASQYGAIGGNISSLLSGLNSSGATAALGTGIGNLASGIGSGISSLFGGGTSPGANTTGQNNGTVGYVDPSLGMTSTPFSSNGDGSFNATGDLNQWVTAGQGTGNLDLGSSSDNSDFWD